jgi:hypothetical protein
MPTATGAGFSIFDFRFSIWTGNSRQSKIENRKSKIPFAGGLLF